MTSSLWQKFQLPNYPQLTKDVQADVCVIGSGLAGVTTAFLLRDSGKKVILITDRKPSDGETAGTTAQINTAHDDGWVEMEKIHGEEGIRICGASYLHALKFIEHTAKKLEFECGFEFVPGYLFRGDDGNDNDFLEQELKAARRAGITDVELVDSVPIKDFPAGKALKYNRQAQLHPLAYISGLMDTFEAAGNSVYAHTRATHLEKSEDRWTIKTEHGPEIVAEHVVVATNVPFHRRVIPHESLAAYRSYVVAFNFDEKAIPKAQFWDTEDPYHYVRIASADPLGKDPVLLVGGEDHRVGISEEPEKIFSKLIEWAEKRFPVTGRTRTRWSAQTIETFDGMPLLGQSGGDFENVWVITGDSGTGMTHATLGAITVSENIMGRSVSWQELYKPSRSRTKSITRWLKENLETAVQFRDWFTPTEVSSEDDISLGSGAIMRSGINKIAVYKSSSGEISKCSAVCPHLGAILRWNPIERSWDCPAHGSRFTCHGELLHGPAITGLSKVK